MHVTTNTNTTATFTNTATATKLLQLQQLVRLIVLRWRGHQKGVKSTHQQYFWNGLMCQGETSGAL